MKLRWSFVGDSKSPQILPARLRNELCVILSVISSIAVSSCSCVGVVGATLGGGVGPYGGLHGLMIDTLQSVRMVTGTGSLIEVSNTSHPDLWWGMRGAGFNFGIVTSATYTIYDFTNHGQAMNADFRFHAFQNRSIFEFAESFVGSQPDNFYIDIGIAYNEDFGGVGIPFTVLFALRIVLTPTSPDVRFCQFHLCRHAQGR